MIVEDERRKLMSGIYIECPKNGSVYEPSSAQKIQPTFFNTKHDLPYIFPKLILFFAPQFEQTTVRRSGYYFIDIFTKEAQMGVSMNEARRGEYCAFSKSSRRFIHAQLSEEGKIRKTEYNMSICYLQIARIIM